MPTQKIDPKVIFASDAPAIDKPPVFSNKTKGWDVSRANDGRPQIKEMNKIQQDTDLKILWLNENAVLPYDASIDYPEGAVTLKDGSFKQLSSGSWVEFLDDFADKNAVKRGIANRYDSSLTYNSYERVILDNGDIVKSTIDGNANDPNVNKTGWASDTGLTSTPEWFGAKGDGVTVDNTSFSALVATNPNVIEADPDATYLIDSSSTVLFTEDCTFNGNGCTIIMDQRWNIQKTPMWGSNLTAPAEKGATTLNLAFMTNAVVGAKVMIFQNLGLSGAQIDPYFASVQDDVDNGEYSSSVNYITAVDTVAKTITLRTPLAFSAPAQTIVYVVTNNKLTFNNVNFIVQGDSSGFRLIDNCDNIMFNKCKFIQRLGQTNSVNLRINTCYNVNFKECETNGVNFTIEYGSNACKVVDSKMASNGQADALIMIWAASTNCHSIRNEFIASENMKVGSISAGVYFGAKTRNCTSVDDFVDGLPYGYRSQWGAVNPQFIRPTYRNPNGTHSLFMDYSHNPHVIDAKFYDKPLRTVGVYGLIMRGCLLDSGWRGESVEVPIMLDLNRSTDTTMVRPNYSISENTVIGAGRIWVSMRDSTIVGNKMTSFRSVNGGNHVNVKFDNNMFGNFYAQNMLNCNFTNNTVDNSILQSGTITGSTEGAVHLHSQSVVNMTGNTIKHPAVGIKRTTSNSQVNAITDGGGNTIIAPTQWDTGVNDATAPTISAGAEFLSRGLEYKSNIAGSKIVWRYNGSSWAKGFSEYPQLTYSQGSFPNTPSGLTEFATKRTISGATVGDTVLISTTSTDIGKVKGFYEARVTAPDTITVYYKDESGVSETIAGVSITLTLIKS